jgi:hypothetical protein
MHARSQNGPIIVIPIMASLLLGAATLAAQQPSTQPDAKQLRPTLARYDDFLEAKRKARAWFDQLEVDPVELMKHGVKGKKKLAEILGVYRNFWNHTTDPAERNAILGRVRELAVQAERPDYHDMATCSDKEFLQNSMSYFRVMWLLREFGINVSRYLDQVRRVLPRMNEHFKKRGPWQRAMFAEYYDDFGLEKPPILRQHMEMRGGVIARRLPADKYDPPRTTEDGRVIKSTHDSYDLTHEVFVAFNYGLQHTQNRFGPDELAYTREVLPVLVRRYVSENNPDLCAEMISCMTYLGYHDDPAYREGLDYLLDSQNPNGTWGDYERYRRYYGKYLDQHVYLHTSMVACRALMEAYEGNWASVDPPPTPKTGGPDAAQPD